ncbi:hypothetical protein USDA257_c46180 [Sinorhizobium fredii USDA 257]|uniref:Uncharacterized protein n=1 Tax=Sinorhizobium fredii (strain USDA 257) TaxID=1185652 RepID=I3XBA0_SINF2|nr:hypothetical protein USDA257_c46180 [Sinorhizobium fredii USDA 257]
MAYRIGLINQLAVVESNRRHVVTLLSNEFALDEASVIISERTASELYTNVAI